MWQQRLAVCLIAFVCLSAPAASQAVASTGNSLAEQAAAAAKVAALDTETAKAKADVAATAQTGASGAELDEQVDEAIDAQEYKELADQEVVAQVVTQESAAKLANSDGDVATTGMDFNPAHASSMCSASADTCSFP